MKLLVLFPTIALTAFFNAGLIPSSPTKVADSTVINHVLDGSTSEWPEEKFETDKETNIFYAVDNNAEQLFIAMKLTAIPIQIKMMRQGMRLYVDIKGKKKKNQGIDFPVKKTEGGDFSGTGTGGKQGFDFNSIKSRYFLNLIAMQLFGFTDGEPVDQGLQLPGNANIAFNWDSLNVLYIEYAIPLNMLDEKISSLDHKEISIGWQINGAESFGNSTQTSTTTTTRVVGVPTSTRSGGSRPGASSNLPSSAASQTSRDKMMAEQSFWTKYVVAIPSK